MRHGTRSRYRHGGCRCDACRAANAAYVRSWKRNRKGDPPHGTLDGYVNWFCRCPECVAAHALDNEERAARRFLARHGIDLDDVLRASVSGDTLDPSERHHPVTHHPCGQPPTVSPTASPTVSSTVSSPGDTTP